MSIVTMDQGLMIGTFGIEQISYDMMEVSDATGAEAVRIFGPPRWKVGMASSDDMTLLQSSLWEAMVLQLKRGINCLAVWDPVRTLPQGTMRGTPTLANAAAAGDSTIYIAGNGSLEVGDWMQLGTGVGTSQLVKVVLSSVSSGGFANVEFQPALRIPFGVGTQVTLDHPVFYARNVNKSVRWDYSAGNLLVNGFALDLLETFS